MCTTNDVKVKLKTLGVRNFPCIKVEFQNFQYM